MNHTILVIDDDDAVRLTLERFLTHHGFEPVLAADGEAGLTRLGNEKVDLVILDLNLPGMDGLDIAREIRSRGDTPIIMLTGRADEIDRIVGLEIGADDYLTKPFNARELVARIRAVLKRSAASAPEPLSSTATGPTTGFGPWRIDHDRRTIHHTDGRVERLTYGEYDLLLVFLQHPNRLLTRDQLLDLSRNRELESFDRSVDIQVSRLRKKIEDDVKAPLFIVTVRGAGYRFSTQQGD
ncbi:MAG: response regulator [Alphaproteobacteria bacterium]